eukprot:TRINITY_DN1947_c0_g1_i1.p1 TRINITY_DN1947_c0_g1~~TRINITY_DN1947_c0_g1_i1.p1  ORF type:complete len:185 (-),score=57.93 TRINITY_DN1947_c0_g1_i1:8-562(-)
MATVYSGFSSALAFIVFTVSFSALHVYGGLIPISPFKFCDFAFKGKELFIPEFDLKAKGDNDLFLLPLVTKDGRIVEAANANWPALIVPGPENLVPDLVQLVTLKKLPQILSNDQFYIHVNKVASRTFNDVSQLEAVKGNVLVLPLTEFELPPNDETYNAFDKKEDFLQFRRCVIFAIKKDALP